MLKVSDADFIAAWHSCHGSPVAIARRLQIDVTNVYKRRSRMSKDGRALLASEGPHTAWVAAHAYTPRIERTVNDGYMVVFSDAHFWPGIRSLAFEALLLVLKELRPKLVISNGDALDGARISRHDPLGWQKLPTVIQELEAVKGYLWEIEKVTPRAERLFTAGNHDSRFDRRLAAEISEFEDVPGMRLQEHLREWQFCYAVLVNEGLDPCYIVHNIRGGVYAPRNNVLAAGCTVFTGHLHSQKVIPVSTLLGDWDGVDCGMLADRDGPQFSYVSSRPTDWREGFAVQRFDKDGRRYPVELCRVQRFKKEARAVFRGEVILIRKL